MFYHFQPKTPKKGQKQIDEENVSTLAFYRNIAGASLVCICVSFFNIQKKIFRNVTQQLVVMSGQVHGKCNLYYFTLNKKENVVINKMRWWQSQKSSL